MNNFLSQLDVAETNDGRDMDQGILIGALAAFGLVFLAIVLGGNVLAFFDFKSLLIVVGGTFGATLVAFPIQDFTRSIPLLRRALFPSITSAKQRVSRILEMARQARIRGALALEGEMYLETDPFVRKSIGLLIDDVSADEIRRTMDIELAFVTSRHKKGIQLFHTMGTIAPAMGLIGTLIGLVQMLQALETPSAIGPAMALALLTTFYGALLANLVFLPIAGKLKTRSEEEALIKQLTIEGIVEIAVGTNPRLIEERLSSFLPPHERYSRYG